MDQGNNIQLSLTNNRIKFLVLLVLWVQLALFSYSWYRQEGGVPGSVVVSGKVALRESLRHHDKGVGKSEDASSCAVYLAPSSVHGIQTMAIYTGRDLRKGDVIVESADGLSIPVIDARTPIKNEPKSVQKARSAYIKLFQEFWWEKNIAAQMKMEGEKAIDFRITFGEFPNHHCILSNMFLKHPSRKSYNDGLLNRSSDPGIGAFSYHMGREVYVHRDVEAAEELFLNYGYCGQKEQHYEPDWGVYVKGYKDYSIATKAAIKTWGELSEYKNVDALKGKEREKQIKLFDDIIYSVSKEIESYNEKAASLMPSTYDSLKHIMTNLTGADKKEVTKRIAREIGSTPRTVQWLEENGMCADTILPRPSKLDHAGQGATAKRSVRKGEIIVPAPMLHITDREALRMNVDTEDPDVKQYQLLMNYCFGHSQSSLLLCPITNAMLINHCSFRRKKECGGIGPNAEYRWASGWDFNNTKSFLKKSISELQRSKDRGLSIEVFATRDIEEGEEIFMDYGLGWEQAWDNHVATWSPPMHDELFRSYISPTELNEKEGPLQLLVSHDLREQEEHTNLYTGCIFWPTSFDTDEDVWWLADGERSWLELSDKEILRRYSTNDGEMYDADYVNQYDGSYWPCNVVDRDVDADTYTVQILQSHFGRWTLWNEQDLPRFVTHFPRNSIRYFNKPYTSDQHLLRAFRHPVEFRDDLFPELWRNLKK